MRDECKEPTNRSGTFVGIPPENTAINIYVTSPGERAASMGPTERKGPGITSVI